MSDDARPKSVTIVAWIFIVLGVIGIFSVVKGYQSIASGEFDRQIAADARIAAMVKDMPRPTLAAMLGSTAMIALEVVGAVLMLKGQKLGRTLIVVGVVGTLLISLVNGTPFRFMIPSLVINAILFFFLFRPSANEYFNRR
ncbi:MAG: hypothetical protein JNL96_24005 [Planctomycetaceae bacterium]|nr:hypothetical protein [Planctomycetaceae bacterium]